MKNTVFKGVATAIITPMFEDGSVDYVAGTYLCGLGSWYVLTQQALC